MLWVLLGLLVIQCASAAPMAMPEPRVVHPMAIGEPPVEPSQNLALSADSARSDSPKQAACPKNPTVPAAPDVFVPFYSRDLCQTRLLARGIQKYGGELGTVHLMFIDTEPMSKYMQQVEEIKADFGSHPVIVTERPLKEGAEGWDVQQVAKLEAAKTVGTPYYLSLDTKNIPVRPITINDLFTSDSRARLRGSREKSSLTGVHEEWYSSSQKTLGVTLPGNLLLPTSVSPVLMHTDTVKNLIADLDANNGGLAKVIAKVEGTEYTLYHTFLYKTGQRDCISVYEPEKSYYTIFKGHTDSSTTENLTSIKDGKLNPLFVGAQSGALAGLHERGLQSCVDMVKEEYRRAGLVTDKDPAELKAVCCADCK